VIDLYSCFVFVFVFVSVFVFVFVFVFAFVFVFVFIYEIETLWGEGIRLLFNPYCPFVLVFLHVQ